jgi:mRNA interferase MazF
MERGEIRWYKFKSPDKHRPVVILTRNSALPYLGEITIAPITSTIRSIPSEVVLNDKDGMKTSCAVNLDHIQTISKAKIGSFITKLSKSKLEQLNVAVIFALGCDN